ncbi:MAG: sulfotransferase domain-containing protein, partial [Bacteroidota bacterium]
GNTWCRFMLAQIMHPDLEIDFTNIDRFAPDIYRPTDFQLKRVIRPRLIKSHDYYDPRYRWVVFVVRDPRDVVLSYYHFMIRRRKIQPNEPMERHVCRFLAGDLDRYGAWHENVGSWIGAREGTPGFVMVRYEDLKSDPTTELVRICQHQGLEYDDLLIKRAIAAGDSKRMRKLEEEQMSQWVEAKGTDTSIPFVRSATAGGWKVQLEPRLVDLINHTCGRQMSSIGYKT